MAESNLIELAKLGDPQAIAALMSQSLESRGMRATVDRKGDCLEVILEAERIPNRQSLTAFVQKGINNLGIQTITSIRILGQQFGASYPAWMQEIHVGNSDSGNSTETVKHTSTQLVFRRKVRQVKYFTEDIDGSVLLDMILVPGGKFMMGSPEDEPERLDQEGPQYEVTVSPFFMGRYPVTQKQWRFVATLPQIDRELNPDPSNFKGDNRPVEQVSWYEAVEFCDRLSTYTKREYRLPSEAEWEYACRAETTTPFYFGKTLTTELANYDGNYTYNDGPKGEYRKETTPIDHFGIANAFGLCDMHGNVYEWCQDHWHNSYEGAPIDGSAWLSDNESAARVRRGGSWSYSPWACRSASRYNILPDYQYNHIGFRVVSVAPRTL